MQGSMSGYVRGITLNLLPSDLFFKYRTGGGSLYLCPLLSHLQFWWKGAFSIITHQCFAMYISGRKTSLATGSLPLNMWQHQPGSLVEMQILRHLPGLLNQTLHLPRILWVVCLHITVTSTGLDVPWESQWPFQNGDRSSL